MSCCIMSPHRFFCRTRLRRPLTSAVIILFMEFSSSLLITWPCHLNLASRILSVMQATFSVCLMTSFLFLSFSETPSVHCSILISFLSRNPYSLLVTVQDSAPYISAPILPLSSVHFLLLLDILSFLASHKRVASPGNEVRGAQHAFFLSSPARIFFSSETDVSICLLEF